MIARAEVVCLTASSTRSGSMLSVPGSTSTSRGRAPTCSITWTVEQKVIGVVITTSPGPMPSAARPTCMAPVQELNASAAGADTKLAKSLSKRLALGPVVIQPERSVSTTSAISSSPMEGGEKGRNVLRVSLLQQSQVMGAQDWNRCQQRVQSPRGSAQPARQRRQQRDALQTQLIGG